MGKLLYIIFIKLYPLAARLIAPFNKKARLWVDGRKDIFITIKNSLEHDNRNRIWIHCSSLGEFEQGLPLIKALKKHYPQYGIVLTFFSPSGYEPEKNNPNPDHIFYMPIDSRINAQKLYNVIHPKLVVFIKYEFWFYYLHEAKKRNIPLLLVSGIFRKSQPFFQWYGTFHRQMLLCFTHMFVQNKEAQQLLQNIEINNVSVTGDTRFDRVIELANNFKPAPEIEKFCADKITIVAGSTWLEDEEALDHYANTHGDYRFIIAPHDIGEERLKECETLFEHSIRLSQFITPRENDGEKNYNTIIVDNIGTLKYLYKYATICYVGGGFGGDGVHNVLEAAVYSKPVVFGPEFEKYSEAVELVEQGGAFDINDVIELEQIFDELLTDKAFYENTAKIAGSYVQSNAGATSGVTRYIQEKRLLTS